MILWGLEYSFSFYIVCVFNEHAHMCTMYLPSPGTEVQRVVGHWGCWELNPDPLQ